MLQISAFAFQNTISEKVLKSLTIRDKVVLNSDIESINYYISKIKQEKPQYILGLGEYSGKDKDKLRLELSCTNKFRNTVDGSKIVKIRIEPFIKVEGDVLKTANGIGNSWCNLISYKILNEISLKNQGYMFIHIPRLFGIGLASETIMKSIST